MPDINLAESRRTHIDSDTTDDEVLNVIGLNHYLLKNRIGKVTVRIATSGGSVIAFDQFVVSMMFVEDGAWEEVAIAFGTPASHVNGVVIFTPDDLASLAHGASGVLIIDASAVWAVRFLSAQAGVTAAVVTRTIHVGVRPVA